MEKKIDYIKIENDKFKKEFSLVLRQIKRYNKIAIFRHIMPDFDALGTQFGLATWIKENFPDKDVKIEGSGIGPYVHIGKNSKIESSILKNSIIFEDVNISNAFMDNSIISEKVTYRGKTHSMDIGASITIEQN